MRAALTMNLSMLELQGELAVIADGGRAYGVRLRPGERRYDIGNFESYFRAFAEFALSDEEYGPALREHVAQEKKAVDNQDVPGRTELLGDFHVRMADLMGNQVLAQMLGELLSRCALITLMYQTHAAAAHSSEEHAAIVDAIAAGDEARAVELMDEHLNHVEASLAFDRKLPTHDISMALT